MVTEFSSREQELTARIAYIISQIFIVTCTRTTHALIILRTSDGKQCVVRVLLQPLVVLLYFLQVLHGFRCDLQDLESTQSTTQSGTTEGKVQLQFLQENQGKIYGQAQG